MQVIQLEVAVWNRFHSRFYTLFYLRAEIANFLSLFVMLQSSMLLFSEQDKGVKNIIGPGFC